MYGEVSSNKRKTVLLMAVFGLLVGGMSLLASMYFSEPLITPFILIGAGIYAFITYYAGSRMALSINRAKEIKKSDNPRLWRIVENLSITAGMPMPKVFIMDDPAPNAFATGRDPQHAVVAATTGLLDMMTDSELEGVMAHELGHVKNYDIRVSMVAFALVAVIGILADIMLRVAWFRDDDDVPPIVLVFGIIGAILAPLIATLIQLAISRKREYLADASGALTTRHPEALASALSKIGQYGGQMKRANSSTAHLFFANPLKKSSIASLFSTHPPVAERIKRLGSMGRHA